MGLEFIGRTVRTFAIVLVIFVPFGLYYFGLFPTLAVLSGGVWGMLNLLFIAALVKTTMRPEGAETMKAIGMALIKFPLLYGAGFALLMIPEFNPIYLLAGFGGIILIIILKVLGRVILGLDSKKSTPVSGVTV
ncbi:MAG: hypothetical protein WAU88_12840 [Candidatus Zixiibacteriota bacterium]|jgi:hypothetical protein